MPRSENEKIAIIVGVAVVAIVAIYAIRHKKKKSPPVTPPQARYNRSVQNIGGHGCLNPGANGACNDARPPLHSAEDVHANLNTPPNVYGKLNDEVAVSPLAVASDSLSGNGIMGPAFTRSRGPMEAM
jgi:hypothetical protein